MIRWVEVHSNWGESVLIVSSDHGHYLVVDKTGALIEAKGSGVRTPAASAASPQGFQ